MRTLVQCMRVRLSANWMTASNRGTCMYMVWTALGCLNQFINSVVWNKNVVNRAPVWCDICEVIYLFVRHRTINLTQLIFVPYLEATRITIGISIAISAAALCVMRHLYQITCLRSINLSKVGVFICLYVCRVSQ